MPKFDPYEYLLRNFSKHKFKLFIEQTVFKPDEAFRKRIGWYGTYYEALWTVDQKDWQISEAMRDIRAIATLITPAFTLSVIKEDEPDNRVLECAVEGQASYIVSGDEHHLQPLKEYKGITILSPTQFLELFE